MSDERRFRKLWSSLVVENGRDDSQNIYQTLSAHYHEESRKYHNFNHITHCLNHYDEVSDNIHCPQAVELAIWFHDVIYEAGASLNEIKSAEMFMDFSADNIKDSTRVMVSSMILNTVHLYELAGDAAYMNDIDLAGIGNPWDTFYKDTINIENELKANFSDDFQSMLNSFLIKLEERENIYYSHYFHQKLETNARQNIRRYIDGQTTP